MENTKNLQIFSGVNSLLGVDHNHDNNYEILHVISGNGSMIIKNHIYPITDGVIFLIPKMDIHSAVPDGGEYVRSILNISDTYMDKLACITGKACIDAIFARECILPCEEDSNEIISIFESMSKIKRSDSSPLKMLYYISKLFFVLSESGMPHVPPLQSRISGALHYINENLEFPMTLDDICAYVHLSKYHFCRLFAADIGMTPFEYINGRRISMAKKYLLFTDMPVSEIAVKTGFSSFSAFSNYFRKKEGISPSGFRKHNAQRSRKAELDY